MPRGRQRVAALLGRHSRSERWRLAGWPGARPAARRYKRMLGVLPVRGRDAWASLGNVSPDAGRPSSETPDICGNPAAGPFGSAQGRLPPGQPARRQRSGNRRRPQWREKRRPYGRRFTERVRNAYCANEKAQGEVCTKFRLLLPASRAFLSASWCPRSGEPSGVEPLAPRLAFASERMALTEA